MNSTYKKPQRKQRRNHHSDLSYAVANISKSPKNHKYS